MTRIRFAATLAVGLASLTATTAARADVPPMCSQFDADTNCSPCDLGNACPSGGTCVNVFCDSGGMGSPMTLTKCETCPNVVPDTTMACGLGKFGNACGAGGATGTCGRVPAWCVDGGAWSCLGMGNAGAAGQTGAGGSCSGGSAGAAAGGAATAGAGGEGTAGSPAGGSSAGGSDTGGSSAGGSSAAGGAATGGSGGTLPAPVPDTGGDNGGGGGGCAMTPVRKRGAFAGIVTLAGLLALLFGRKKTS